MSHQPVISFSISFHFPFNRAGGRTSNVLQKMKPWLHNLLFVAAGALLAVLLQVGHRAYEMFTHPLSPITNDGFVTVQVAYHEGKDVCEIKKGESRLLPYGLYKVTIPETGASFLLFKNNRGAPVLHSVDGTLIVQTDANSSVMPEKHLQNKNR